MDATLGKLMEFWSEQGIKLRPGLDPKRLESFESQLNVKFPNDFRQYFLMADGFDGVMDSECISFFPIDDGMKETAVWSPASEANSQLFAFADFLISSHVYMINLEASGPNSGSVYVVYDNKPELTRKVAGSFSEFLDGYIATDYSVLFPA